MSVSTNFKLLLSLAALLLSNPLPAPAPPISPEESKAPEMERIHDEVVLSINPTVPGRRYQLQQSDTLDPASWVDVGAELVGDGHLLVIGQTLDPAVPTRFYRFVLGSSTIPTDTMTLVLGGTLTTTNALNGTVINSFHFGRYEVTWGEWKAVRTEANARGYDIGDIGAGCAVHHPVHTVSWHDAVKWCNRVQ